MNGDEVNIFDAEEPRFKRLDYAAFLGSRLHVTHVAKLYTVLFDKSLVLQSEVFQGAKLGERIQLTSEPDTLRQAVRVAEGYFVEGNIDSTSKFERLKLALSELGMEEELFIKFA